MDEPQRRITAEQPPIVVTGVEWQRIAIGVLSLLSVIGMALASWVGSELGALRQSHEETKGLVSQLAVQSAERHGETRARTEANERDLRRLEGLIRGGRR